MQFDPILDPARAAAMKAAGHWPGRLAIDYLDACIAATPEKTAIVAQNASLGRESRLSFRELGQRVERIAAGLAALGIGRNDVVSYQLPNWWEFTALHLACLRIGAVSNPLMPIFRERELGFMLGLAESRLMVVPQHFRGHDYAAMLTGMRKSLPRLEHVLAIGGSGAQSFEATLLEQPWEERGDTKALFAERRPAPDDVIQVLYTSGTTGEPKGVMHSSNTLLSNILPYAARLGLSSEDVVLMASPMAHQTGFMYGLMMPLVLGATAVLQDVWEPVAAAGHIRREGCSFTMASTPFLSDLTETVAKGGNDLPSLRTFVAAGAPIPRVLVERARHTLGAAIVSAWGMTENGAVTTTKPGDPEEKAIGTDGCALPGAAVRVVDGANRPLPPGEEGMLKVRSCSNFLGYLKRPALYGHDAEGWFDTGDLARIDAEGYIRITGRSKDIIIRGAENIPVVEVEGLLFRHPGIQAAAIVGMPDERLGERACAFIVTKPGLQLDRGEILSFLEGHRLAKTYLPERIEFVDELPRTPSGKVQKFKLREMAKEFRA